MKKTGFFVIGLLFSMMGTAQEIKDDFDDFLQQESANFNSFVDDANREFISFMRDPWKEHKAEKPVEKRVKPEPVNPVVYDKKKAPKDQEPVCLTIEEILDMTTADGKLKPVVKVKDVDDITFDKPEVIVKKKKEPTVIIVEEKVVEKVEPEKKPENSPVAPANKPGAPVNKPTTPAKKPVVEVAPVDTPAEKPVVIQPDPIKTPAEVVLPSASKAPVFEAGAGRTRFVYGGVPLYLSNAMERTCKLNGVSENAIADAYESLCKANHQPLLNDLLAVKKHMHLNDWALYQLIKKVSDTYCGANNESVVMQQFLLNELGCRAKMARKAADNKLVLYVAPDCQIYGCVYVVLDGHKYYDMNSTQGYSFYMCQQSSSKARNSLNMSVNAIPTFGGERVTGTRQAKGSAAKVTLSVPKALMDFYKNYPQCDYRVYAMANVDPQVEATLLSSLSTAISGKSEAEAANILINFVQTGFQYQRDEVQFGYEKPFFVEELFYYPYSDCEDRSVLFAYLVRKLMKRDVVYLDYPDHIATAVRFEGNVGGDYLMVGGQKYTVCDPTYIGASIGTTMPQFKTVAAKVLKY